MATRFYLSTGHAADINLGGPLSGGGLWESSITPANTTRKARTVTTGGTANVSNVTVVGTGTNPNDVLYGQFMSDALDAQTISGNVSGVACCRESSTNTNANAQLGVFVVDSSGVHVATLYGGQAGTAQEFNNPSANNRIFPAGTGAVAMTSYACAAGDRIVIEVGARLATTRTGDSVYIYLGDGGASDLPLGNGTSNNLTINPWVEFANTLTFFTPGAKRSRAYFMGA